MDNQQFVTQLEQTLSTVLSPDNTAIKAATQKLKKEFYPNKQALPALIHVLQNSDNDGIKQLAAVEAKKLVSKQWEGQEESLRQGIRDSLLQFAFSYPSKNIRHSTARIIASIADIDIPKKQWESLLPALVAGATDSSRQTREMATFIIFCVLENFPLEWLAHTDSFIELFGTTLQDSESPEVQSTSVSVLEVISSYIEEEDELLARLATSFQALLPLMVTVLKQCVAGDDMDRTKDVFSAFNSFVLLDMRLLGQHFFEIVQFMVQITLNQSLDPEIRGFGLKTLTQCVSYRKSKLAQAKMGPQLTQCALRVVCEADPDDVEASLDSEDEENENEEDDPSSLALRLLNTLAVDLSPSQVIQPVLEAVVPMLSSSNAYERRAALLAIGVSTEGAPDYMSARLPKVIQFIVAGLTDSSIVVQAAALRSLSQLGEDLKDAVAEYHTSLMGPIINIIDSTDKILVYKYATYALDTLVEYMANDDIKQYLEPLMNKLFQMLDRAQSSSLKSAIVSAIGSVAYASGIAFKPYFEPSIKFLEQFISNMDSTEGMSEEDIELCAQTFENISSMARAVRSEAFSAYAEPLINAAYSAINNSESSRLREAGFAFISNMAKVYGSEFSSFLDRLLPEIYKCLEQNEIDLDIDDDEDIDDVDLAEKLNIHTGVTVEKEVALVALSDLATTTGAAFSPYVEKTVSVLQNQIEESYAIREAALSALWKLVFAMFKAHGAQNSTVQQLIQQARKTTAELLPNEYDVSMVLSCLDCLVEYSKSIGKQAVFDADDQESLPSICEQLGLLLKGEHLCQAQDEDEDVPSDEVDASETDAVVYDSALEVLVGLAQAFGPDFGKLFAPFKDLVTSQANSKDKAKRVSCLGCLAEISNSMGSVNPYQQEFLELFVNKLTTDSSTEVRGNAAYGIGIIVENAGFDTSSVYATILTALSKLLNNADTEFKNEDGDDETKEVTNRTYANACGCVSRMALKHESSVHLGAILPVLLAHLPLQTAFEENKPIFELIMKLYGANNELILNSTPKVTEIFEHVFQKEVEKEKLINESTLGREENLDRLNQFDSDETKQKVIALLKFLEGKFPGAVSSKTVLKSVLS
ncbi:DEKNAAC103629 [Brettanomyces naardenensis]|uniref:DEKNAAC103629 n=1 Tax=Brettanomyces naardenensis TaxID=13370 RepID=A0A448YP13_BRENA|nr:DEKNAAC103629 [Brettanomyces naardenensis]